MNECNVSFKNNGKLKLLTTDYVQEELKGIRHN